MARMNPHSDLAMAAAAATATGLAITLPWTAPVLRSNDRDHWRTKAKKVKEVRQAVALLARGQTITPPVVATLVWHVTDKRRRDVGASAPTLKAAVDGLVDAGVIPDDSAAFVVEERYRIETGTRKAVVVHLDRASRPPASTQAHAKVTNMELHQGDINGAQNGKQAQS